MKARYILIISLLAGLFSSCKVNDIALYSDAPRIEFSGHVSYTFSDSDYLKAHILNEGLYSETTFTAQLIGYFLEEPLTFVVTSEVVASAFDPEVQFDNPYVFPTGVPTTDCTIRIACPDKTGVSTRNTTNTGQLDLVYDSSSSEHQLGQGRVENLSSRVSVVLQIYPSDWNNQFWGAYSTSKYFLIMETFQAVHGDIETNTTNKVAILAAYNSYKAQYGALYGDDEDSETEIAFPS